MQEDIVPLLALQAPQPIFGAVPPPMAKEPSRIFEDYPEIARFFADRRRPPHSNDVDNRPRFGTPFFGNPLSILSTTPLKSLIFTALPFIGLQISSGEAVVDTAAQDAVVGNTVLESLFSAGIHSSAITRTHTQVSGIGGSGSPLGRTQLSSCLGGYLSR